MSEQQPYTASAAIREQIATAPWKDAKPNPKVPPHSYVMTHWSRECAQMVQDIRGELQRHGYDGEAFGRMWRYLDIDGFTYWMYEDSWTRDHPLTHGYQPHPYVLNRRALET